MAPLLAKLMAADDLAKNSDGKGNSGGDIIFFLISYSTCACHYRYVHAANNRGVALAQSLRLLTLGCHYRLGTTIDKLRRGLETGLRM